VTDYCSLHPTQVTREQAMVEVDRITSEYQKYRSMLLRNSRKLQEVQSENEALRSLVAIEGGMLTAVLLFGGANPQMPLADFLAALQAGKHLKP